MSEKNLVVLKGEKVESLLKDINANLVLMNGKKDTQIENQRKFESRWGKTKLVAIAFLTASVLADVIKPSEDGAKILERVLTIVEKLG